MATGKLERLLNLTALLLDTSRPLSADEIRNQLEGYPSADASFHRTFERDKADLRDMGIPLRVEPVPGTMPQIDGYRIPREEYALRDPGLTGDELGALHLAASAVQVEGLPSVEGIYKLGGIVDTGAADFGVRVAPLPADPNLARLFDAVASRTAVRFRYKDEERTVNPYRLEFQRGRWYLTGFDQQRQDERNFRLDRVDGAVTVTDDPPFAAPATSVPGQARGAWELGAEDPVEAVVRVDGPQASWAARHVGPDRVEEDGEGAVLLRLPVTNRGAFRAFVLSFLEHAEVLEPPELRQDVIDWLEQLA